MNMLKKSLTLFCAVSFVVSGLCATVEDTEEAQPETKEIQCSDEKGIVAAINDEISETLSEANRQKIVNKMKKKLNSKGRKAKLIADIKKQEAKLISQVRANDQMIINEIKTGAFIDRASAQVAEVFAEEKRTKIMAQLKNAFNADKEEKIRADINASDMSDAQKDALIELVDMLHCEVAKIPVAPASN